MSSEIAIRVENISKCYEVYGSPQDRLKQFILPGVHRLIGKGKEKYYKEFWALSDISFDIKRGESVGILGRNGSGKSTLLQCITGTMYPTNGTVTTKGRIAALLELGSGFNPDFTGRENVYLNGMLLGFSREQVEEKFDAIASFADIGLHLDQPVKTYSSGMMLRLAFAVQVQVEPDILIIDEALAVGDALFQKRCFQRIEKLLSDGTTLLFVSHDQESVRTLTSRALLLTKGRVTSYGLSSEVVLEYRRQLHNDESIYFSEIAKNLACKISKNSVSDTEDLVERKNLDSEGDDGLRTTRSSRLSFGDVDIAKILKVDVLDKDGLPSTVFYPGDTIRFRVTCQTSVTTDRLNVAIRIRNKEGIKIYSWGTLNQDMKYLEEKIAGNIFWTRQAAAREVFIVDMEIECRLGVNLYEIQACITYEETPDYLNQRILHWIDEAGFFQVLMKRDEYFFGGVVDLRMCAKWKI